MCHANTQVDNGVMTQLRVGVAQLDSTVGDLAGNATLIRQYTTEAARHGADVVVFPELALTGHPLEGLATRTTFTEQSGNRLSALATELAADGRQSTLVIVGYLDRDEHGPRNALAALYGGDVVAKQFEHHPGGSLDEHRCCSTGPHLDVLRLRGIDIGMVTGTVRVGAGNPVATLAEAGVNLILTANAAPFERGNSEQRVSLVSARASETGIPIASANLVGAQDDLVFDGDSCVVDSDGTVLNRAPRFVAHLILADVEPRNGSHDTATDATPPGVRRRHLDSGPRQEHESTTPPVPLTPLHETSDESRTWSALLLGLRDYARKNGFNSVVFGFSGGIDSAVCAALAADALGSDALYGVSMPSRYSSQHSRDDAAELAQRLDCHFRTENVEDIVAGYVGRLELSGLAEENIQARVRGILLMALSNMYGHLVLAPGNKTELAVGYSTLYGDAVGGFAPLKDVFKTQVWRLARWRNNEALRRGETPPIPERSISKPASAELRPDQADTDSLPEYTLLDDMLERYIEGDSDRAALVTSGFDAATVDRIIRMVSGSEYKRHQYPLGTKISPRAFDRDRRFPVTNAWDETR